jgi:hypothetical protein
MSVQSFEKSLQLYYSWLKAHERIVLILGAGFLAFHFYSKGLNAWIDHDKRQATVAQQKVQADEQSNKVLADQVSALRSQVALQAAQYERERQDLLTQTKKQQELDQKMAPSDLANRWAQLLKTDPQEVAVSKLPDHLDVSNEVAHETVRILEDYPRVVADNLSLSGELVGEKALVDKQNDEITGLNQQIVDEKSSHKKDVDLEKAKAKRSWLRGFKIGVITGAVGGEVIRVVVFHKL